MDEREKLTEDDDAFCDMPAANDYIFVLVDILIYVFNEWHVSVIQWLPPHFCDTH